MESKNKQAWIIHNEKIISFHEVPGAIFYEAEEKIFWEYLFQLVDNGYRIQ